MASDKPQLMFFAFLPAINAAIKGNYDDGFRFNCVTEISF